MSERNGQSGNPNIPGSGGPLDGVRVVEFAAAGPGPFAAMMLSDMGAQVTRIERVKALSDPNSRTSPLNRGRRSIAIDLKEHDGVDVTLRLIRDADALIEGFRPGVMEGLGIAPDTCFEVNPRLVYGRMTGWGQTGPSSNAPGHDINYIALCGTLAAIGPRDGPPVPPLTVIGDFGGGGMFLAFGLICGILEARTTGNGQVVDAAMIDGISLLMNPFFGFNATARWNEERGTNYVDGGAPFYGVYECADGEYISLGAIEPRFFRALLDAVHIEDPAVRSATEERSAWPYARAELERVFRSKTRGEWCELLEEVDTCISPVLTMSEAPRHPHHVARHTYVEIDGIVQANAAPRFSRTPGSVKGGPPAPGEDSLAVLEEMGFGQQETASLLARGIIAVAGAQSAGEESVVRITTET